MVASATLRPRTSNPYAAFRRRAFCVSVDRGMGHDSITVCDADQERMRNDQAGLCARSRSYPLRSGCERTALRSTAIAGFELPVFHHSRFQHILDEGQKPFIVDTLGEQPQKHAMADVVEKADHIHLDDPFRAIPKPSDLIQGGVTRTLSSKPVGMVRKDRFVHEFKQ